MSAGPSWPSILAAIDPSRSLIAAAREPPVRNLVPGSPPPDRRALPGGSPRDESLLGLNRRQGGCVISTGRRESNDLDLHRAEQRIGFDPQHGIVRRVTLAGWSGGSPKRKAIIRCGRCSASRYPANAGNCFKGRSTSPR